MNDTQKVQYIIEILKAGQGGQQAVDEFKKVEQASKSTSASFGEMKSAVGAALAAFGAVSMVRDWIREAEKAEEVNTRLTVALRNQVAGANATRAQMEDLATAMSKVTNASGGTVKTIQSQLLLYGATADQVRELVPLILDLGAAGESIEGVTAALGGGLNGQFVGLQRLLKVGFDQSKSDAENLALAIEVVRERYAGFAREVANTPTGQLRQMRKEFSDLKEQLGTLMLEGLSPALELIVGKTRQLNELLQTSALARTIALGLMTSPLTALLTKPAVPKSGEAADPTAAARAVRQTQEQIQASHELDALVLKFNQDSLRGIEQQRAAANAKHREEIAQIDELGAKAKYSTEQIDAAKTAADESRRTALNDIESARAFEDLENQITITAKQSSEERSAQIQKEFDLRMALYQRLAVFVKPAEGGAGGLGVPQGMTQSQYDELVRQARKNRANEFAGQAAGMNSERESLTLGEGDRYELTMKRRIASVEAYYNGQIELAQGSADQIARIEEQKTAHIEELNKRATYSQKLMYDSINQIGDFAAHQFASGMASAIGDFIDGTKSAKEAFQDFAVSFLKAVAEMIMYQIIFNALKSTSFFGGGAAAGGAVTHAETEPPRYAANGLMASGIPGVQKVFSTTLFSKHNVVAGEAGAEMLAVLARPQLYEYGGISGAVGMAQGHELMIAPAEQIRRATRAANGYAPNGGFRDGSMNGGFGGNSGAQPDGRIVIEVRHNEETEARIVNNSVQRAKVEVVRDISRDTSMRRAVSRVSE